MNDANDKQNKQKARNQKNRLNRSQKSKRKAENGRKIPENKHTKKILQKKARPGSSSTFKFARVSYI